MRVHVSDHESSVRLRFAGSRPARRKTITQILRAAYRKHGRDPHTRHAVRRCLR